MTNKPTTLKYALDDEVWFVVPGRKGHACGECGKTKDDTPAKILGPHAIIRVSTTAGQGHQWRSYGIETARPARGGIELAVVDESRVFATHEDAVAAALLLGLE